MGHVFVTAQVRGKRARKVRFLVDTGATYSLVSPALAKLLGLPSSGLHERVLLATGKAARLPVSVGLLRIENREASTLFWVGKCDEPLLGVEALEALGLSVDPSQGKLKPTRAYATRLGGFRRR